MRNKLFHISLCLISSIIFHGCKKNNQVTETPIVIPQALLNTSIQLNNLVVNSSANYDVNIATKIKLSFNNKVDKATVPQAVTISLNGVENVSINFSYENNDSSIVVVPSTSLKHLSKYLVSVSTSLTSTQKGKLNIPISISFITSIDSTNKFPVISDNALLDTIQKRTFKYFWDFAHPVSGLSRERNSSGEIVTIGGSGFGIMSLIVAVDRNFITRAQALDRLKLIVDFLKNKAQKFHGAFPHWINGTTGEVIPFSSKDNGADLVETSYLIAGLLSARMYFNESTVSETKLRADINSIWDGVEWNWFRQNNQDVLYWHWSPNFQWEMNLKIQGWNECLITYILASSSNNNNIPASVYHNGFARSGAMVNNNSYYNIQLPLGPAFGGPLFYAQYSFLGIDPRGLSDQYTNYNNYVVNHTRINYEYCKANPKQFFGYSENAWGLTASDIPNGYAASSPTNDLGVITPTAALSSFPYTPKESMQALRFFYYKLGDKIWSDYGFVDAYKLQDLWFASSTLAIDQGPIIIMIENYRSGLIWSLLTSCPELKVGMRKLGFTAPYL